MTGKRSVEVTEIPVHLVPSVVADQIREVGNRLYRITVKRSHWHHYNISIRTKTIWRELRPVITRANDSAPPAAKPGKKRRGCPA